VELEMQDLCGGSYVKGTNTALQSMSNVWSRD
jgi:hypothetical protein